MLLRYCCMLLLLGRCSPSAGQTNDLVGSWTDGMEAYSSQKINDSLLLFTGGSLHEGVVPFAVRIGRDHLLSIADPHTADTGYDGPSGKGEVGNKVNYKVVNGTGVLIIESPEGDIEGLLRAMAPDEDLGQLTLQNKVNYELAGKYIT